MEGNHIQATSASKPPSRERSLLVEEISAIDKLLNPDDPKDLPFGAHVDWFETDSGHTIFVDLPGVETSDVRLKIIEEKGSNPTLMLIGNRKRASAEGEARVSELGSGDFYRSFSLGDEAKLDEIQARFLGNGLLHLTIPKKVPLIRDIVIE